MKDRITYVLPDGEDGIDPSSVRVTNDTLKLPGIQAAKEWRRTFAITSLPPELQSVLHHCHELHMRWVPERYFNAVVPLVSRISPGLHLFYTPRHDDGSSQLLCTLIKRVFGSGVKCHGTAFSRPQVLSGRFASSAAQQYYSRLPSVQHLQDFVSETSCAIDDDECLTVVQGLNGTSLLELDYDAISQSISMTAVWPTAQRDETLRQQKSDHRVEIGILNKEKAKEDEQISLGGFLTVLGDDDRPKATLFSFPSRHHEVSSSSEGGISFSASFRQPTGLHPTLELRFDKTTFGPPSQSCALHAYLTLPSTLFFDRYQFTDELFLQSQNLVSLRSISGETDLEAPEWVVHRWGSAALFELMTPDNETKDEIKGWTVSIPMHLRYLSPQLPSEGGITTTSIPYPVVFWACPAESGLKMSVNPFDRVNIGYDGLFGPKTMFWHVPPSRPTVLSDGSEGSLMVSIDVPVLDVTRVKYVEAGSGITVLIGLLWICWKMWEGLRRPGKGVGLEKKRA